MLLIEFDCTSSKHNIVCHVSIKEEIIGTIYNTSLHFVASYLRVKFPMGRRHEKTCFNRIR